MKNIVIDTAKYHWHNIPAKRIWNTFKYLKANDLLSKTGLEKYKYGRTGENNILTLESNDLTTKGKIVIINCYKNIKNDWNKVEVHLNKCLKN